MLTIGLINCDNLTPQVIEQYGDYPTMFANLFDLVSKDISWKIYDATREQFPADPTECDAYVITGSHFSVYDKEQWISSLLSFIQQLWSEKIKTVGICFGHQAIAKALSGHVDRAPSGWGLGVAETTVIQQKPWMKPWQQQVNVHVSHQDQVLELPEAGQCLAKTSHCPHAMLQFGETFLTIQGHPEFSRDYTQFLINKRQTLFEETTYQEFLRSLSINADTLLFARWMINFISDGKKND